MDGNSFCHFFTNHQDDYYLALALALELAPAATNLLTTLESMPTEALVSQLLLFEMKTNMSDTAVCGGVVI